MINSMTGYGQAESDPSVTLRIRVELRSVNHRYLDIALRMPRDIQYLEDKLRRQIQKKVGRGRVDAFISLRDESDNAVTVSMDLKLAMAYARSLTEMSQITDVQGVPTLEMLAGFPDVFRVEKKSVDEDEIWACLDKVANSALENLLEQRREEGGRLEEDLVMRLNILETLAQRVTQRAPLVVQEYKDRIEERIREFLGQADPDPGRLLTEVAIFADRCNVTEELVRLGSHLAAFRAALRDKVPVGRKLDFMAQEMFREINTIGSKSGNYEIAGLVVEMKTELEKIREQVQNIE